MISIKKYLERNDEATRPSDPKAGHVVDAAVKAYSSALLDMGKSGYQACPAFGSSLQQSLEELERKLGGEITALLLQQTSAEVSEQLSQWGERTAEHLKEKAQEVKDLLIVLARTAESLGKRDQRYTAQLQQFTTHLRAVANLEDLTQVRSSLMQTAGQLKTCVDQMEQDSKQAIAQLQTRVSNYENKLKETEELALRDMLTGLPNRLHLERYMEWRRENRKTFCVAFLDVNHFKQVNDRYGHPAGDNLLKQFAEELRTNLRPGDLVGRWGGDEFVVLLDCDLASARVVMERVRKWVFGDYTLGEERNAERIRVWVSASVGMAEWAPGESVKHLIERADQAMYEDKSRPKPAAVQERDGHKRGAEVERGGENPGWLAAGSQKCS
ncbi:MAG TPA: GGDEF domain-containing protein [Candidatus Bathyarchaeia archaeon]|nr:GGDEF domain-containing protein [Candidatus Bathyarchaeia archaeon]